VTDEPLWLSVGEVLAVHGRQLAEHGGGEGLRDAGLLGSAISRSQCTWQYGDPHPDLAALAASLAFGLISNHPFVDGNKRTGYVCCRLFLRVNGADLIATPDEKYLMFYAIAAGEHREAELADWLRQHLTS